MNGKSAFGLLLVLFVLGGCSTTPPSDRFLTSTLALAPMGGIGGMEKFHLRVVDLYNLFDLDVTKKWRRVHENAWDMVIVGKDPTSHRKTRMVISLTVDLDSDRTVIVRSITEEGKGYPPDSVAALIRQLDRTVIPKGR